LEPFKFGHQAKKLFKPYLWKHYLKREIIATSLSSALINDMGISFVTRLQDETGATSANIIRAYTIVNALFNARIIHDRIDALAGIVDVAIQHQMHHELNRLIRRAARWFLKNEAVKIDIESTIKIFAPKIAIIDQTLSHLISGPDPETQTLIDFYQKAGAPLDLATKISSLSAMFSALDIVSASNQHSFPVDQLAIIYYEIGQRLELGWLRILIKNQAVHDHWEALARASFRDDLDRQQRHLSLKIIKQGVSATKTLPILIDQWLEQHQGLVKRWYSLSADLRNMPVLNFTMFAVLVKELWNMNAS
jgi:glutamate dehydrogenase